MLLSLLPKRRIRGLLNTEIEQIHYFVAVDLVYSHDMCKTLEIVF